MFTNEDLELVVAQKYLTSFLFHPILSFTGRTRGSQKEVVTEKHTTWADEGLIIPANKIEDFKKIHEAIL